MGTYKKILPRVDAGEVGRTVAIGSDQLSMMLGCPLTDATKLSYLVCTLVIVISVHMLADSTLGVIQPASIVGGLDKTPLHLLCECPCWDQRWMFGFLGA